ncbi:hypothetical protein B0J13DRAFT_59764 [Dactylonectria estremocensis]|uniref:Uncharacterized protein n=1 Tax=Dactylonectria estremocensis TaxID=1079267 RepID=A0A9P9EQW8_9HYPO|nr:hypothetical protein B0J13DRAFT_59764 [Dactylonectria estremocensis]
MTEPPADWSPTTVSDHPEWTTNTWITTTSEGSDEPTIVPVLIGCPACGGGGSGIILFGFPKFINTLFKFPGFPQFSFPCIPPGCDSPPETHEDDGDDSSSTDQASETTAASSTCTEEVTASDCLVACTTYTGPGADPTPDCTTTCTKTQTGCDVTGVTSTTSAEACSATGDDSCLNCAEEENLVDWEADPEDPDFQKRSEYSPSLGGHHSLKKRSPAAVVTKLGDPALGCSFTKLVQYPEYPGGGEMMKPDLLGTLGTVNADWDSKIKRWFIMTRDAQCIPSMSQVAASGYHAKGTNGRWVQKDLPTTDHFYEKSWLKDFFVNILDSSVADLSTLTGEQAKINCKDFNYYTDESAAATVPNQLAQVFNAFPSKTDYLENFIGMDDYINAQCKVCIRVSIRERISD